MVSAFEMPDGIDGQQVYATLRDRYGIVLAGGQGKLRGRIVRIGHMGYMNEFDIVTALAGLELALAEHGYEPPQARGRRGASAGGVRGSGSRCLTATAHACSSTSRSRTPAWRSCGRGSRSTSRSSCPPTS